jgi:predicted glycosyltransferase involved in capsule biosynthesis
MKVAVVIPWRSQPSRIEAFEKLCSFFAKNHRSFELIISNNEENNFNRSKARNLGAKKAIEMGADIIIFNDADFFAEPKALLDAVKLAYDLEEVTIPYNIYCQHSEKIETDIFFKEMNFSNLFGVVVNPPVILENGLPDKLWPCSGSVIFPTKIFQDLGGYEEKISEWGPEDQVLHRIYFDKYKKLFNYVSGIGHSTYNDPTVRYSGSIPEYQKFFDFIYFKDKLSSKKPQG